MSKPETMMVDDVKYVREDSIKGSAVKVDGYVDGYGDGDGSGDCIWIIC